MLVASRHSFVAAAMLIFSLYDSVGFNSLLAENDDHYCTLLKEDVDES